MAFNGAFTITETAVPNIFILTDTSLGSDVNLTGRVINIYRADGTLYVDPIAWAIGDSTITLDILPADIALNIQVAWISSVVLASPSTYSAQLIKAFTGHGELFYYRLTQLQLSNPAIIQSVAYFQKKLELREALDSAVQAIDVGHDLFAASSCVERYAYLIANQQYFF